MGIVEKLFGTHSDREIKMIMPKVDKIFPLRDEYIKLSDEELKYKTVLFKKRLANGETMDMILPEAFATVRRSK